MSDKWCHCFSYLQAAGDWCEYKGWDSAGLAVVVKSLGVGDEEKEVGGVK